VNLSDGGAQLTLEPATAAMLASADHVVLEMSLERSATLRLPGVIVWQTPSGTVDHRGRPVHRMGLRFTVLSTETRTAIRTFLATARPLVLALGLGEGGELRQRLNADPRFALIEAYSDEQAVAILHEREVAVVLTGPQIAPGVAVRTLTRLALTFRGGPTSVVLAAGRDRSLFQDLVDGDSIFYLSEAPGGADNVAEVVAGAARHDRTAPPTSRTDAQRLDTDQWLRVLELARRLASEPDVSGAVRQLVRWMEFALLVERAYVLIYDRETETLWAPAEGGKGERRESAAAGLAAYALRTSTALCIERASGDPRYDREADDPDGDGSERVIAVPVAVGVSPAIAVLVGIRAKSGEPFSEEEFERLHVVANESAPTIARLLAEERLLLERDQPFRREALVHHQRGSELHGDVLRLSPGWTVWTYRLLLLALFVAVVLSLTVRVHEYASGPSVVRFEDAAEVAFTQGGVVTTIYAQPGARVVEGQALLRINDADEVADAERLAREFDLNLTALLRDPSSPSARQQLATTRGQKESAEGKLRSRTLRATRGGVVNGVRVRLGQRVNPGDVALTLVGDQDVYVVAVLPGRFRAELKPEMLLRFELTGYEHVYQTCPVETVGEVVSSQEALRYLGTEPAAGPGTSAGASPASGGPVVIVRARMTRLAYEAGGRSYRYHDGMPGTSDVRVRSELLASALVPAVRRLLSPSE
jgi:biotin carboxyl carrier protein